MATLSPVQIDPTQDVRVDVSPIPAGATVTNVQVTSSDETIMASGVAMTGGGFRCVSMADGTVTLTITGTNSAGSVLTDTVDVTRATAPAVATDLGSVVTAIPK